MCLRPTARKKHTSNVLRRSHHSGKGVTWKNQNRVLIFFAMNRGVRGNYTDFVTLFPACSKGQDLFFAGTVVTARQNVFAFFNPSPSSCSLRCWHFVRRPSCAPERVLSRRRGSGGGGGGLTVAIRGIIFALIIYPSLRSPLLSYVTVG